MCRIVLGQTREGGGEGGRGQKTRGGERQSLESGLDMATEVSCLKPHSEVISCCCFTPHGTMHDAQQELRSYPAKSRTLSLSFHLIFFPYLPLCHFVYLSLCVHSLDTSFFAFLLSLSSLLSIPLYPSLSPRFSSPFPSLLR